jgi:iron complex outermembrane receptor protein
LKEIVVTATRREEKLQKVPVAVTALTQQAYKEASIQYVTDITYSVPGLLIGASSVSNTKQERNIEFSARGQDNGVITLFADAPYGNLTQPYDMESVQILRGIPRDAVRQGRR